MNCCPSNHKLRYNSVLSKLYLNEYMCGLKVSRKHVGVQDNISEILSGKGLSKCRKPVGNLDFSASTLENGWPFGNFAQKKASNR